VQRLRLYWYNGQYSISLLRSYARTGNDTVPISMWRVVLTTECRLVYNACLMEGGCCWRFVFVIRKMRWFAQLVESCQRQP